MRPWLRLCECQWDSQRCPIKDRVVPNVCSILKFDMVESPEKLLESDAKIHSGQIRACATVRPESEGEMAVAESAQIETFCLRKLLLISIGRRPIDNDLVTSLDLTAADLDVSCSRPGNCYEWAVETQQLLDSGRDQLRPVT